MAGGATAAGGEGPDYMGRMPVAVTVRCVAATDPEGCGARCWRRGPRDVPAAVGQGGADDGERLADLDGPAGDADLPAGQRQALRLRRLPAEGPSRTRRRAGHGCGSTRS